MVPNFHDKQELIINKFPELIYSKTILWRERERGSIDLKLIFKENTKEKVQYAD